MGVHLDMGSVPADPTAETSILDRIRRDAEGIGEAFGGGYDGIVESIGGALRNGLRGITSGGLFGSIEEAGKDIHDGQKDLEDRADLIDAMLDQGGCYMPAGLGFEGAGRLPFSHSRGPSRGVRFVSNGIQLLQPGAWQIMVEVNPDFLLNTPGVNNRVRYHINCYRADGSLMTYQQFTTRNYSAHSVSFGADFIVDEPNCFVAVHVNNIGASWRGHLGGWAITRFVAKRWSSESINPPSGGAADTESD